MSDDDYFAAPRRDAAPTPPPERDFSDADLAHRHSPSRRARVRTRRLRQRLTSLAWLVVAAAGLWFGASFAIDRFDDFVDAELEYTCSEVGQPIFEGGLGGGLDEEQREAARRDCASRAPQG